jgi:hypothetical protein
MSLFNINFINKIIELLPPDKREVKELAWVKSLGSPIQYLKGKFINDYKEGSDYPNWVAGSYGKGDIVVYKKVLYESNVDGNTDTPPSSKWNRYLDSFIGSDDRVKYNGQKVVLEYALNQYYKTVFRQPNDVSDIYIETLGYTLQGFLIATTEPYCSTVGQTTSSGFIGSLTPFLQTFNFTIWFPVSVYAATNESEVRTFVNKIIPIGLNYNISTY